jgi:hypothetical protein
MDTYTLLYSTRSFDGTIDLDGWTVEEGLFGVTADVWFHLMLKISG